MKHDASVTDKSEEGYPIPLKILVAAKINSFVDFLIGPSYIRDHVASGFVNSMKWQGSFVLMSDGKGLVPVST